MKDWLPPKLGSTTAARQLSASRGRLHWRLARAGALALLGLTLVGAEPDPEPLATVVVVAGQVEVSPAGTDRWLPAATNTVLYAQDQLRTGPDSRATLKLRNNAGFPVGPLSQLQFRNRTEGAGLRLLRGVFSFFNRDKADRYDFDAGGVNMVIRGTEFAVAVAADETAVVTLFDGQVDLTSPAGPPLNLRSGEVATLRPGEAPQRTARVRFGDWSAVQWALYYPAILDPLELGWAEAPEAVLAPSLDRYRRGNLIQALDAYPAGRTPASPPEKLYLAALQLAVGNVTGAESLLRPLSADATVAGLAAAHLRLIATVLHPDSPPPPATNDALSATALLADSYVLQARGLLLRALEKARAATVQAPAFGFAWVRLAELEFSHGNNRPAEKALTEGLALAPGNAQGYVLRGFIEAAQNRIREAQGSFQTAIALDGNLANAWLGRGLCRIRRGDLTGGREDLIVAVALEPQRAELRSYLAKAFADSKVFSTAALPGRAAHELKLAREIDPHDPTTWLYSALLAEQGNRVNDAISDLERSAELNDNRAVFRSDLLLDQDRAVRSANLANIYADAGFTDVSLREATLAVNHDYANASAHLFLANSYDSLRDPQQVALRYETPWFSEYLIANLLGPVGAGSLSQVISQNEYSKFFQRDGVGLVNSTTYTSNGDWLEEASQYGQFGDFAYALDTYYRSENGQRPNNDLQQLALTFTGKQQLGLSDSVFLQMTYYDAQAGDVNQYYNPARANLGLRTTEQQEPLAIVGWHHEWKPGMHTLLLVSPWNNTLTVTDPNHTVWVVQTNSTGTIGGLSRLPMALDYESGFLGGSTELQQIWQSGPQTLIVGVRYQLGEFDVDSTLASRTSQPFPGGTATSYSSSATPNFDRLSLYAYDQWQLITNVLLTVGVTYDRLTEPTNFRSVPASSESDTIDQVSPKVGLTVTPWKGGVLRGAYTRSLGGVSFDQSFRLEPVQVAGFDQAFRSLIPEPLAGSVGGQSYTTWGLGFDQSFPTRTYVNLLAQHLGSEADQQVGGFTRGIGGNRQLYPVTYRQTLDFNERGLMATVSQLVGRDLALTARYWIAQAELTSEFPELPAGFPDAQREDRSTLQQLTLGVRFNHPSGFFASWESNWIHQTNEEDVSVLPGDSYWQHNLWAGWRFYQRRLQVAVGLLNLTDQDYQLYPINYYLETYRQRTLAVSASFSF